MNGVATQSPAGECLEGPVHRTSRFKRTSEILIDDLLSVRRLYCIGPERDSQAGWWLFNGFSYFCASGFRYGISDAMTASMFINKGEGMTRRYLAGASDVTKCW